VRSPGSAGFVFQILRFSRSVDRLEMLPGSATSAFRSCGPSSSSKEMEVPQVRSTGLALHLRTTLGLVAQDSSFKSCGFSRSLFTLKCRRSPSLVILRLRCAQGRPGLRYFASTGLRVCATRQSGERGLFRVQPRPHSSRTHQVSIRLSAEDCKIPWYDRSGASAGSSRTLVSA
jgi:hypothetical protein